MLLTLGKLILDAKYGTISLDLKAVQQAVICLVSCTRVHNNTINGEKFLKLLTFIGFLALVTTVMADGFTGLWATVDDETKEKKSVVRIYQHEGKYFGRIVELFKNKEAKAKLPGEPKILGLDIIWNMEKDGKNLEDGKILDPKKGKVYSCEIWRDGKNLIVRGKIAFLGRNQTWLPYNGEPLPQANEPFVPNIPPIK
jgi:uncharacterized protein (DUF2147 family)